MAHEILGQKFFNRSTKLAWHGLGINREEDMTAMEAFSLIGGYDVSLEPVFTHLPSLTGSGNSNFELPHRAVIRHPIPEDPEYRVFGQVGPEYQLVTPLEVVEIWDGSVQKNIETMGVLRNGEIFFMTTHLSDRDILGDPIKNYLLFTSPYTGTASIGIRVTGVRVVCMNTLVASASAASENYKVSHAAGVHAKVSKWLALVAGTMNQKSEDLIAQYVLMARTRVQENEVDSILMEMFPNPSRFRRTPDAEANQRREGWYEYHLKKTVEKRTLVKELFEGRGTGMDVTAAQGTYWGLWNAVTEFESWRPSKSKNPIAESILVGDRGDQMSLAFDVVMGRIRL